MTTEYQGSAVDGHLLAQAGDGNHEAIARMAQIAADHIRSLVGHGAPAMDDVTPWLLDALGALASGQTPNAAFGWSRIGRQPRNSDFLLWNLTRHIDALRDEGMDRNDAIALVGVAACMDVNKGGSLERAYDRLKDADIPDTIFPIPASDRRKLADIETRIAAAKAVR